MQKEAFGEYFPTVYLDFVEISYGQELIEGTGELRYSYDRNTGTYINGSFSIYFTREAMESQSKEDLVGWILTNLDELYLYSWISGWKTINEKVKNSSLDLRELFYSMEPVSADELTSDHPLFSLIITEMKNAFFTGGNARSGERENQKHTPMASGSPLAWPVRMCPILPQ